MIFAISLASPAYFFNVFTIAFAFHYTGKRTLKLIPMKNKRYFIFYIFPTHTQIFAACTSLKHRFALLYLITLNSALSNS